MFNIYLKAKEAYEYQLDELIDFTMYTDNIRKKDIYINKMIRIKYKLDKLNKKITKALN